MKLKLSHFVSTASLSLVLALLSACGGGGDTSTPNGGSVTSTTNGGSVTSTTNGGSVTSTTNGGSVTSTTITSTTSTTASNNGGTSQATIDTATVKETLKGFTNLFPGCTVNGVAKRVTDREVNTILSAIKATKRIIPKITATKTTAKKNTAKKVSKVTALIPSAPISSTPIPGECGGTLSFPTWNHLSGTTTLSVKLDNYCTVDIDGNKTTMNGTVSAVDVGTTTDSGPVTQKVKLDIPNLTVVEKTASGATISSTNVALSGFEYTPTPGSTLDMTNLTSGLLGNVKLTSLTANATDNTGKTTNVKVDNLNLTASKSGTDTQISLSAKVYNDTKGYSEFSTDTPLLIDSDGNFKSGAITFTGANNSKATISTLSSDTNQTVFSISVNGTTMADTQMKCSNL